MKYLLILGMLFTGWQAFGYHRDHGFTSYLCYNSIRASRVWYRSFKRDLSQKIDSLEEQAGGLNYVNVDDLRPRQSFTKPHRVKLLSRFAKPVKNWDPEIRCYTGRSNRRSPNDIETLIDIKLEEFAFKTFEYLGYPVYKFYDGSASSDLHTQDFSQPDYYIEITQEVRWWFNDNIKPLLEDIIMLYDLEDGEYEPY